jgi:UDP-N-acetylmuramyl tripeptide synthase
VTYFGVQDDGMALGGMGHASDSKHCRRCGAPYVYDAIYMGHLGRYHCPTGDSRRPTPAVSASEVVLDGTRGARFTLAVGDEHASVALPLPGLYNVYNALGAAALTHVLGADLGAIVRGLEATKAAFGRAETVRVGGRELAILLVKNPAGANEVLRTLALDAGEHDVLAVLNDRTADGHDVSWIWDADFELVADRVRRVTCSGTRAAELALRLKYAGVAPERLVVVPALEDGLDAALADGEGRLVALPTYTAMLDLRRLLVARGAAEGSFA